MWMSSVSWARGTFREAVFDEGGSVNPGATRGNGLPQSGAADREAVEK